MAGIENRFLNAQLAADPLPQLIADFKPGTDKIGRHDRHLVATAIAEHHGPHVKRVADPFAFADIVGDIKSDRRGHITLGRAKQKRSLGRLGRRVDLLR